MHDDPDQPEDDREAVEVALRDTRGAEVRRDAATEHVGQPTAATLVQQDEQGQQQARDPSITCRTTSRICTKNLSQLHTDRAPV